MNALDTRQAATAAGSAATIGALAGLALTAHRGRRAAVIGSLTWSAVWWGRRWPVAAHRRR